MPLDYRKEGGRLVWVRNPFTGTVTYFTDIQKKQSGFRRPAVAPASQAPDWEAAEEARLAELEAARRDCPFCPGNEDQTPPEILRVAPEAVIGCAPTTSPWLIRAFPNLFPRLPESCTGGRNESYLVVEDPRHFADGARHHDELLYTALLPFAQFRAMLHADIAVARIAYSNPAVHAVLMRKNQGRESGASQPHLHNQVIGADQPFPPVVEECRRLAEEPGLWRDILRFVADEGFLIDRREGGFLYFCPFGAFPRSYEVVFPDVDGRLTEAPRAVVDAFADLLHTGLTLLGPLPLDYEIHDANGVPLHAHVCARHYPYSNIGGTLNLPSDLAATLRPAPH
jgi:galactose-1-phosphate uridylyltransferase